MRGFFVASQKSGGSISGKIITADGEPALNATTET